MDSCLIVMIVLVALLLLWLLVVILVVLLVLGLAGAAVASRVIACWGVLTICGAPVTVAVATTLRNNRISEIVRPEVVGGEVSFSGTRVIGKFFFF